jgi:hypothetical protein
MQKNNALRIATVFALVAALAQIGSAQTINQRLRDQNQRINQGLKDRQLNRYQSGALRADDHKIHAEERYDRLTDHGKLTGRERSSLERQLNRNSKRTYDDRHNK